MTHKGDGFMQERNYVASGVSASFLLFLTFLVLKLTGVISWSWWWVFAPIWVPYLLIVLIMIAIIVVTVIKSLLKKE